MIQESWGLGKELGKFWLPKKKCLFQTKETRKNLMKKL